MTASRNHIVLYLTTIIQNIHVYVCMDTHIVNIIYIYLHFKASQTAWTDNVPRSIKNTSSRHEKPPFKKFVRVVQVIHKRISIIDVAPSFS